MLTEKFKYKAAKWQPFLWMQVAPKKFGVLLLCLHVGLTNFAQTNYFPPVNNNQTWQSISPDSLGWCTENIAPLYQFLETNNTKAFIVLKDGKLVLEKYFGTFTQDSFWYWASAGKSLTAVLVGKTIEQKMLTLDTPAAKIIGNGFTNCTIQQENAITIKHQLTMTSGLDDAVTDNHCTLPSCLLFKAEPATRWAYHNAPYTLLDSVLQKSTGLTLNALTNQVVEQKTGINGLWIKNGWNNVFLSNARSMARFGLLAQNNFIWNTDTILFDTVYKNNMVTSSQNINPAYGYLWWLNGSSQHMLPQTQFVFNGPIAPDAPHDMIAAIGKNGQIVSLSKKEGLVLVRMGDAPGTDVEVPTAFCNAIWQKFNAVTCNTGLPLLQKNSFQLNFNPNPAVNYISFNLPPKATVCVLNSLGQTVISSTITNQLNIANLPAGIYYLKVSSPNGIICHKWVKQ